MSIWGYNRLTTFDVKVFLPIFGEQKNPDLDDIKDINIRELIVLTPLAFLTILFGVYPSLITDITSVSVENLIINFNAATGLNGN